MRIQVRFARSTADSLFIEGDIKGVPVEENNDIALYAKVGAQSIDAYIYDSKTGEGRGFLLEIPLPWFQDISGKPKGGIVSFSEEDVAFLKFMPFSAKHPHGFAVFPDSGYILSLAEKTAIKLTAYSESAAAEMEKALLKNATKKLGRMEALKLKKFRSLCHTRREESRKTRRRIWLISDRISSGGDNGEALFRYLTEAVPDGIEPVFAVSAKSSDFARVSAVGRTVDFGSDEYLSLYLSGALILSSHADDPFTDPLKNHKLRSWLRDLAFGRQFVFLGHGITMNDLSGWLHRYKKNLSLITCASPRELDAYIKDDYLYPQKAFTLTGFCRYDLLEDDKKKQILFMPSWRKYLISGSDEEGTKLYPENVADSEYVRALHELLNDEVLASEARRLGYSLVLRLHPDATPLLPAIAPGEHVEMCGEDVPYSELFAHGSLLVTDYSSVHFDFAYLGKPVIYYQFDEEEFFSGEHVFTRGWFSYREDGFGEVTGSLEEVIRLILQYMSEDCRMKPVYMDRAEKFFAFRDRNNCERVADAARKLIS
jgi:hypothetical protein